MFSQHNKRSQVDLQRLYEFTPNYLNEVKKYTMEKEHRRIILDNIGELIKLTNYKILMQKCLERKIMFPVMELEIEKLQIGNETKHKLLFEKLTRRGPNAFQGLIEICKIDFIEAAALLQLRSSRFILDDPLDDKEISIRRERNKEKGAKKKSIKDKTNEGSLARSESRPSGAADVDITDKSVNRTDIQNTLQLELYTKEVPPTKLAINVTKSKRFHAHKTLDTYDMRSRQRGVFFLVNIINFHGKKPRNGASVDRDNLITLFRGMEFEIFYYEDITSLEFDKLVDLLISSQYLKKTDSLVFAVLTHGDSQNGKQFIEFTDGSSTTVQDILKKFNNINCKSLVGKPKIFLFPMCRGNISDTGTNMKGKKTEKDSINHAAPSYENIATSSDMKICYATVPGFQTHRDPDTGSWYIQVLCKVFAENSHEDHLDDMLKMIGEETSKIRTDNGELQTTSTEENGFHKHLYFNPGFYGDLL